MYALRCRLVECWCKSFACGRRYNVKEPDQSVLLLGDTGGGVTVLEFSKASKGLFLSQDSSKQGEGEGHHCSTHC